MLDSRSLSPQAIQGFPHLPRFFHHLHRVVLITIAYETSFVLASSPYTPVPLQAYPIPLPTGQPLPIDNPDTKPLVPTTTSYENENEYIVDMSVRPLIRQLRHPPTPPPPQQTSLSEELLPVPGTTSFPISKSIKMLVRAQARMRISAWTMRRHTVH